MLKIFLPHCLVGPITSVTGECCLQIRTRVLFVEMPASSAWAMLVSIFPRRCGRRVRTSHAGDAQDRPSHAQVRPSHAKDAQERLSHALVCVEVTMLSGKSAEIKMRAEDSIKSLKVEVKRLWNVRRVRQQILLGERVLGDHECLGVMHGEAGGTDARLELTVFIHNDGKDHLRKEFRALKREIDNERRFLVSNTFSDVHPKCLETLEACCRAELYSFVGHEEESDNGDEDRSCGADSDERLVGRALLRVTTMGGLKAMR